MNTMVLIVSLGIGVIFIGLALLFTHGGEKKKKDNIKALITDRKQAVKQNILEADDDDEKEEKSIKIEDGDKKSIAQKLKHAEQSGSIEGMKPNSIRYLLIQAGSEASIASFWVWSVISCLACLAGAYLFGTSLLVTILIGIVGFFGLPRFILKSRVKSRQKKFLEEFAEALEAMTRLLKSGMPITEAISMVAREYSGPIGQEMLRVYEAQRVGDTLPEAVLKLAIRVPIPEVQMFSTAVVIQTQTGSSLSEVLTNLANVIRQRFRLRRKVEALSAEAKISAGIIACLPLVVVGAMYALNREYIMLLFITDTGKMLTYGALTWMGIGVTMMRQMINFKI